MVFDQDGSIVSKKSADIEFMPVFKISGINL